MDPFGAAMLVIAVAGLALIAYENREFLNKTLEEVEDDALDALDKRWEGDND